MIGLGLYLLVAVLFLELRALSRTVTLPARCFYLAFAYGSVAATASALLLQRMALLLWSAHTVSYVVGPITEEVLKAIPVVAVALLLNEGRRLSIADVGLVGVCAGLGFEMVESGLRAATTGSVFHTVASVSPLVIGWRHAGSATAAGHAVWTGLVGVAAGVGVRYLRRAWAWLLTGFALAWVILDHALYNRALVSGARPPVAVVGDLWSLTWHGRLELIVLPVALLTLTWFERARAISTLGPHPELLLAEEHGSAASVRAIAVGGRRGPQSMRRITGYLRRRRELEIAADRAAANRSQGEVFDRALRLRIGLLAERLKASEAIPGDSWVPKNLAHRIAKVAKRVATRFGWKAAFLLLFMFSLAELPRLIRHAAFGAPLALLLASLGFLRAATRLRRFRAEERPVRSSSETAAIAARDLRGMLLVGSTLSGAMALGAWFLPSIVLGKHPGAEFLAGSLGAFGAAGGNPVTLLGLAAGAGADDEPDDSEDGGDDTEDSPDSPDDSLPDEESPDDGDDNTDDEDDPASVDDLQQRVNDAKSQFEDLQSQLSTAMQGRLDAINGFYYNYNTSWARAVNELEHFLGYYGGMLPQIQELFDAFKSRTDWQNSYAVQKIDRFQHILGYLDLARGGAMLGGKYVVPGLEALGEGHWIFEYGAKGADALFDNTFKGVGTVESMLNDPVGAWQKPPTVEVPWKIGQPPADGPPRVPSVRPPGDDPVAPGRPPEGDPTSAPSNQPGTGEVRPEPPVDRPPLGSDPPQRPPENPQPGPTNPEPGAPGPTDEGGLAKKVGVAEPARPPVAGTPAETGGATDGGTPGEPVPGRAPTGDPVGQPPPAVIEGGERLPSATEGPGVSDPGASTAPGEAVPERPGMNEPAGEPGTGTQPAGARDQVQRPGLDSPALEQPGAPKLAEAAPPVEPPSTGHLSESEAGPSTGSRPTGAEPAPAESSARPPTAPDPPAEPATRPTNSEALAEPPTRVTAPEANAEPPTRATATEAGADVPARPTAPEADADAPTRPTASEGGTEPPTQPSELLGSPGSSGAELPSGARSGELEDGAATTGRPAEAGDSSYYQPRIGSEPANVEAGGGPAAEEASVGNETTGAAGVNADAEAGRAVQEATVAMDRAAQEATLAERAVQEATVAMDQAGDAGIGRAVDDPPIFGPPKALDLLDPQSLRTAMDEAQGQIRTLENAVAANPGNAALREELATIKARYEQIYNASDYLQYLMSTECMRATNLDIALGRMNDLMGVQFEEGELIEHPWRPDYEGYDASPGQNALKDAYARGELSGPNPSREQFFGNADHLQAEWEKYRDNLSWFGEHPEGIPDVVAPRDAQMIRNALADARARFGQDYVPFSEVAKHLPDELARELGQTGSLLGRQYDQYEQVFGHLADHPEDIAKLPAAEQDFVRAKLAENMERYGRPVATYGDVMSNPDAFERELAVSNPPGTAAEGSGPFTPGYVKPADLGLPPVDPKAVTRPLPGAGPDAPDLGPADPDAPTRPIPGNEVDPKGATRDLPGIPEGDAPDLGPADPYAPTRPMPGNESPGRGAGPDAPDMEVADPHAPTRPMPGNAGAEVAEDAAKTKTLPGDPPVERVPVDGAEAGRPGGEAELPRAEEPLAEVKPAAEPAIEPPPRTSAPDEITPLNEPARAPTGDHPADQPAPEVGDPLSPRPEYYSSPKGGTFDDWAQQNRDTVDFYQAHPEAREKPNLPWDHPDNLPDGTPLTSEQLKNFEGMPLVNQLGTQAVADKYGVDLVLRGTNPESLAHLEAGAVPKPMSLKPKTVKDIDLKISGGTLTSADQGLVAHFEPQLNGKTLRSPDPATRLTATDPEFQALSDKEQARFFARDLDYVVQQGHIDDLVSKGLISVDENGILRNTGLSKLPQFEGQPFAGDHDLYSITKDGQPIGNDAAGNQLRLDIQRDLENFGNGGHRDHLHWDYKAFELEPNPDYAGATQENRRMHDMFYEIINKHVPVPLGGNGEALIQFSPKSPPSVRYASSQDVFIARPADGIVPGH